MSDGRERKEDPLMGKLSRAVKMLEAVVSSLEELAASSNVPLAHRKAERMLGSLREIVRSMGQTDTSNFRARKRFWNKERKAVTLAVKIVKLLSPS